MGDNVDDEVSVDRRVMTDSKVKSIANETWWFNFYCVTGVMSLIAIVTIPLLVWAMASQSQLKDQRTDFIVDELVSISDTLDEVMNMKTDIVEIKTRLSYIEGIVKTNSSRFNRDSIIRNSVIGAE